MRSRCHQHAEFKVWSGRHIWLWFVADYNRKSGMIGAAASEAEAISEARRSIEEMSDSLPISGRAQLPHKWSTVGGTGLAQEPCEARAVSTVADS